MKKITQTILTTLFGTLLVACNNGGNSTPSSATPPTTSDIRLSDINLATQILPLKTLDAYPMNANLKSSPNAATFISAESLELTYETLFCQLKTDESNPSKSVLISNPQCQADIAWIKNQAGTANFDLNSQPILNNPLGITGVTFESITYTTALPSGANVTVSGGLVLPQLTDPTKIKGVVTYFHGTTFNKSLAGSNYESDGEVKAVTAVFASQGYIVVLPDYVGQGVDWQNVHPYVLYPKISVQAALDMLEAVKPIIQSTYATTAPIKLFSAGYSEGGAYSLWFNSMIQNSPSILDPFYKLTHSVGMEGAYSVSNVTNGYLFNDVVKDDANTYNIQDQGLTNLVKPLLTADALLSYATYSLNSNYSQVFNMNFFNMTCGKDCNVNSQNLNIQTAFALPDTMIASQLLNSAVSQSANGKTYPSLDTLIVSPINSIDSLVDSALISSGNPSLMSVMQAADVNLTGMANNSVSIISLNQDSVVVRNNYDWLLQAYPNQIKTSILIPESNIQVLSPFDSTYHSVDHLNGLTYEYLYAVNIFNSY